MNIITNGDIKLQMVYLEDEGRYFRVVNGEQVVSRWSDVLEAEKAFDKELEQLKEKTYETI